MPTPIDDIDLTRARDVNMVERLMRHPDWKMPENFEAVLPTKLAVAMQNLPAGSRAWLKCVQMLYWMHESNRRAAPPAQDVNLNVTGDFAQALAEVAMLTPEDRAKLEEADLIYTRMSAVNDN